MYLTGAGGFARRGRLLAVAAALVLLIGLGGLGAKSAAAQESDAPVLFSADDITYDGENGLVNASGSVEVAAGERILMADRFRSGLCPNSSRSYRKRASARSSIVSIGTRCCRYRCFYLRWC